MAKTLVVVESPTKAKTIEKYLGRTTPSAPRTATSATSPRARSAWTPTTGSSRVRDPRGLREGRPGAKRAHKRADDVVLATDYDREGEAIAYRVAELLAPTPTDANRVTFTEITRDAILEAFANPARST